MKDNISTLYGALKNKGYTDIGKDEAEFRNWIGQEGNVKKLHGALSQQGFDDIGDENTFSEWVGLPKNQSGNVPYTHEYDKDMNLVGGTAYQAPEPYQHNLELELQTNAAKSEPPKWNVPQYDWKTDQQKKIEELSNSTTATPVQDQYGNEYYPLKPREVAYDEAVKGLKDISERKAETKSRLQTISNDVSNELNRLQGQAEVSNLDKFRPANLQSLPVNPVNQELMPEYTALRKAQRLVEESNNIIEEASKKGNTNFMVGLARGFWDNLNAEDYTFGADDAAQSAFLYRALDKAEKGESLTKAEETLLDAAAINMAVQSYYAQDLGKGYGAGQVTAESIPFMLEMAINPISASGKTTAKALLNYGLKKFAKNKAAKVGARLAGDALAATGMAATTGFGDVLEGTTDRLAQNYNYQLDDEGRLHVEKKDDATGMGEALGRSFATRAIENQSEMIFKAFEPIGGFMKGVQDILPGGVNKFFEMLGNNKAADAYRAVKNSPVFRNYLVKDIRNATQIGGLGEEYLEEVYNNLANAAIGEMKWEDVVSLDKNIDTLLGLAPTQVMFGLLGLGGAGAMRYQTRRTLEDLQATMNEQQRKDLEGLLDMGLDAKEVDVRGFIRNVMNNQGYTIENKRDLIKAAYNVAKQNGIDELTEADTIDKVNAENSLIDSVTDPSTGIYTEITATLPDAKEGTIEVPGYVVGWLGEGEKRQPIFVQEGMENTYENRRVLKPGQWSEEAVQQMPAEEVKALSEEMIREEATQQAEQEAKYAPEVLNAQMQQGVPFNTPSSQIVPVAPMPEGNGWVVEEYALDTDNKVSKTPIVRELTNDEYRAILQGKLDTDAEMQRQLEAQESVNAPVNNVTSGENVGEQVNAGVNVPVNNENVQPVAEGVATEQQSVQPKQPTLEEVVATLPKTNKGEIDYKAMTPQQQYQYTSLSESPEVALEDLQADIAAGQEEIAKIQEQLTKARGGQRAELRDKIKRLSAEAEELKSLYQSVAPKQEQAIEAEANEISETESGLTEEVLENGDVRITNKNSLGEVATISTQRDGKIVSVDSYDDGILFEHTEYDNNGKATSVTRYDKSGSPIETVGYVDGKREIGGEETKKSTKKANRSEKKPKLTNRKKQKQSEFTDEELQPMDALEFAANNFAAGNVAITTESFKKETGYGESERKKFMGLLRTPEKGGMTIEEAAEKLVSLDNEGNGQFFGNDTQEARNAIIELLGLEKWGDVTGYIKNNRLTERKKREEAEYAEYEAYIMEELHVTPEEYELLNEAEEQRISELYDVIEEVDAIFAEAELERQNNQEYEQGRNVEGNQGQSELLYEARTGDLGGNQRDESQRGTSEVGGTSEYNSETPQESASGSKQIEESLRERAKDWGNKLGVKVNLIESIDQVTNREALRAIQNGQIVTGWFEESTGEVCFYMPYLESESEIDSTYIHEVVAHKGLHGLLGNKFDAFCDEVWESMSIMDKAKYMAYPGVNGNKRAAADEYIAHLAENIDVTDSAWSQLTELIKKFLKAIGLEPKMTNADIANTVKKSYQRLLSSEESAEGGADGRNDKRENGEDELVNRTLFRAVTDKNLIDKLEREPKLKVYRAMQLIDGKLYPPMSAKVDGKMREPIELGKWEMAEERPDLADEKGYFKLDKGNKSSLKARYNPYIHTSTTPLNDQFSSAQSRPELVTVEVEIPKSELTSGYKAEKAKDAVGKVEWKAGVVQSKLSGTRTVILSRYDKPIRIVPDSEVADEIVKMFDGKDITMPSNVVTPSLRAELEKRGVPFVETDNQGKAVGTRFRVVKDKNELVAVHNISEENLRKVLEVGGLIMPSIAITKADMGHEGYGEISLLFDKETINPTDRRNKVYGGDAWTPRFPSTTAKINDKVSSKVYKKIKELIDDRSLKDLYSLSAELHADNIERTISDRGVEGYYNKEWMKLAYLLDNGKKVKIPMKMKDYGDMSEKILEMVKEKGLKASDIQDGGYKFYQDNTDIVEAVKRIEIENKLQSFPKEKRDALEKLLNEKEMTYSRFDSLISSARRMEYDLENGGLKKIIDRAALRESIEKKVKTNNADYNKWVDNLFDGIVEKYGIRNNRDWYTPSGNLRPWEQLYDNATPANILKYMLAENEQGGSGGFFDSNIMGASAETYESIEEIREKGKKRLIRLEDGEYDEWSNSISERMSEICNDFLSPSQRKEFGAAIDAKIDITNAVAKDKTADGIYKAMKRKYPGFKKEHAKKVEEIVKEIQDFAIGYFEAKPRRIVPLSEVRKAIVPKKTSSDIVEGLKNNGIEVATYKNGDEAARARLIKKESNGIRFRFIGERGARNLDKAEEATTRLDNLAVAREMEAAEKDAKTIKMATGWERGADGLWRYETMDIDISATEYKLHERLTEDDRDDKEKVASAVVYNEEIQSVIDAYPDWNVDIIVYVGQRYDNTGSYTPGFDGDDYYMGYTPSIEIHAKTISDVRGLLSHEIQHAIQEIEGFAEGGSLTSAYEKIEDVKYILGINGKASINDIVSYLENGLETPTQNKTINDLAKREGYDSAVGYVRSLNPLNYYKRISGEVEARNVEKRLNMTLEQRRNSLASETEDVARKDQIFLKDGIESGMRFRLSEKGKQIQTEVDKFTSKYNSKPVSVVDSEMTDEELEEAMPVFLADDTRKMISEGKLGSYSPKAKRIFIFADNNTPESLEDTLFHENLHTIFADHPMIEEFFNDFNAMYPEQIEMLSEGYEKSEIPEEVFVTVLAASMQRGNFKIIDASLSEDSRQELYNTLKEFGYDYEQESRGRIRKGNNGESSEVVRNEEADERNGRTLHEDGSINRTDGRGPEGREKLQESEGSVKSAAERKERLTDLFNKVADMGLQGVLGNKNYTSLMVDIYKTLPEEVRAEIADDALRLYGGSIAPAVSDYIGPKSKNSIMDKVVTIVREALRKVGFDLDLNANEVRYMAWRSKKPLDRNNMFEVAEDIDMKYRLKVGEYDGTTPDGGGTRFRNSGDVLNQIKQARREVEKDPSEAQKEAGNYKKGHITLDGFEITLENPKGGTRSGVDKNGKKWSIAMNNDYGYIRGTEAVDGDHIDVFLSDNPTEGRVFVVDQLNEEGFFDESKVMYGFDTLNEARDAYLSNYEKGWEKRIMAITEISKEEFKKWIDSSHRKTKAFSEYKSVKSESNDIRFRVSNKLQVRDEYEATIKKGGYQAREAVQDAMLSLRKFQELIEKASGKKIRDFENAWMHENRLSSVVQAEIHDMERKFYKPMMDAVKKLMSAANLEQEQVADYLMLKHGIERNREMAVRKALTDDKGKIDRTRLEQWYQEKDAIRNDATLDTWRKKQEAMDNAALNYGADMSRDYSGLTSMFDTDDLADSTQKAYDEVEALENAHPVEAESLGKTIKAMTQNTLDKSFESGLMDRKVYDELSKDMYDYYIPLRGFEETTSEEVYAYLDQDRGAFNAPLKRAKGRSSKSDNPIAYLKSIAESGIMQGNRNKMKQSFLNMVINNPSDLVSVREGVWVIYNPASGEWEAASAPAIPNNATPADVEAAMEAWEQQMEQAAQNDPNIKKVSEAADVPYRVVGNRMDQHQIIVKRLGKSYTLTINGNPRLAMAINGQTNPNNTSNDGKVAAFVNNKIGALNRSLAAWYTTRNPDFVASNFMRDTFYTNTIVRAKEGNAYANKFHKNYALVLPKMLGLFRKYEKGTLNPADQTEAAFIDFMMNGGETGYSNLKDVEEIKKQISKELKGNRFAKIEALAEKLDILNRAVENTARFAAFLTSREDGRSIAKSVFDAKEISVNFNKKGAGGTFFGMTGQTWFGNLAALVGASGRALYVFFNAAIQGSTNLMHVMKVNPKGTSAGLAAMFLMGAIVPFLFGDDDDEKGYYDLPEHVRRNHLIIPGTGDAWISIPLPIEYRIMYGIGELLTSWRTGHERGSDIARKMLSMSGQALPLNFLEEGLEAFVPSAVSPIYQVMTNSSWTGLPIYKENDFNKDDPEYTKAYSNVDRNLLKLTKALYEWTFDEENQKERIDLNPAIIETLAKGYFGGLATQLSNIAKVGGMIAGEQEFDWRNIPIGNRVLKTGDERTKEKRVTNEYFENMEKLDFLQSRERMLKKTEKGVAVPEADKSKAQKDLEAMQGTEVYKKYQEFKKQKKVVDKIRKTIKEKGSTPEREKQLIEAQEKANKSVR